MERGINNLSSGPIAGAFRGYDSHQLFRITCCAADICLVSLCRQLREEFDSGADVKLSEDLCPHDVATLIKEYFRDLPEPLLPHDLYQPFLASQSEYRPRIRARRSARKYSHSRHQVISRHLLAPIDHAEE